MSEIAIQQKRKGNKILQLTEEKEKEIARHFIQHQELSPLYVQWTTLIMSRRSS